MSVSRTTNIAVRPADRTRDQPPLREIVASPEQEFDQFYGEHRDDIGRALVFVLGDQSLAQEAVDEAMVKAYQKWSQVAGMQNPAGWVFVVGKRWGLSWQRGRRRERRREELYALENESIDERSTADYLDLIRALDGLTTEQRTIVACRFSLGLSVEETAAVLGIRKGTVKSRLSRSVERLRQPTQGNNS